MGKLVSWIYIWLNLKEMLYRTYFSLNSPFPPSCTVWKELMLLLAEQLFLPCSHSLRERNKLCKSSCWQLKWLLVHSQWVWLHHTVNERDSEWDGVVQTPFYYSPVPWVRQEKSQHLRQGAAKASRNDGCGPHARGDSVQSRAVLDLGKHSFSYLGG